MEPGAFTRRKCPCCKNPWSTVGESQGCERECLKIEVPDRRNFGLDPGNLDLSVRPQDNFFLFGNGKWIANNPCPNEYPSWNTFRILADQNLTRLKELLTELSTSEEKFESGSETDKVMKFYSSYLDESAIEAAGLPPVFRSLVALCHAAINPTDKLARLHSEFGLFACFRFYSMPDKDDSNLTLGSFSQGGLGMPDREYYFADDKLDKREKYLAYIEKLLHLMGEGGIGVYADEEPLSCRARAERVFAIEKAIAGAHMTRVELRDPHATWNKMTPSEFNALARRQPATWASYLTKGPSVGAIDFEAYLVKVGKGHTKVNIANKAALQQVASVPTMANFCDYLAFHACNAFAPDLSKAFVEAHFDFHERTCKGTKEQKPRWKQGIAQLENAIGDALSKQYIAKYSSESTKVAALNIVSEVREALKSRLQEVGWMSDSTRAEAIKKLNAFRVKIGFPDPHAWTDYTGLIIGADHFANSVAARRHLFGLDVARMDKPTDKDRWFMFPHQVNAYYHPLLNEIVFPSAILQAPFFDIEADVAVQFGSFGCVVAHEMTHGFDDSGRKYDSIGNLRDWWAPEDAQEYERRKAVMVDQANQIVVLGQKLNGSLTTGENIADLGGVKLSFRALMSKMGKTSASLTTPLINGFTPAQRFFLAWAQTWRDNAKEEYRLQMLTVDPHGPHDFRCNGPLSNLAEYHEAFNVVPGDPMYKPESERVDIW